MLIAPVLLIAILTIVWLATRASGGGSGHGSVDADLGRWVAAGLITAEQAEAIRVFDATPASVTPPPAQERHPRHIGVAPVAEALGYLGGALATVGLVLLVSSRWPDMGATSRVAISGSAAVALTAAGAVVRAAADAALARLRAVLWFAASAAAAVLAGVVAADGFDAGETMTAVACSGAVAMHGGLLWWWRERPVQQVTCLAGVATFVATAVLAATDVTPAGLALWSIGCVLVALGLLHVTPTPLVTTGTGALATVVGTVMVAADWPTVGLPFAVLDGLGLLALALVRGPAPTSREQTVVGAVGGLAVIQVLPVTLGFFSEGAGIATGAVVWATGAAVLALAAWSPIRLPRVVEGAGCAALVGGAALTAAQSVSVATVAGLVTAVGLISLGMLPGRVMMSLGGAVGLLLNVPWAIGHFFPGSGRAPLLIMVSGVVIIAVAVFLGRTAGRLRRELLPRRHGRVGGTHA